jgi:hypothetical protein
MANSQCGNTQNGFMLTQTGENTTPDAGASSLEDDGSADAPATTDAFDDATDAQPATDALSEAGGGG